MAKKAGAKSGNSDTGRKSKPKDVMKKLIQAQKLKPAPAPGYYPF